MPSTAINAVGTGIFKSGIQGQQFFRTLVMADGSLIRAASIKAYKPMPATKAYACNTPSSMVANIASATHAKELLCFYKTTHSTISLANGEVNHMM